MIRRLRETWRDSSFSAWNAGLIAVIISYAGPMMLILQAADEGGLSSEHMISWVWAASMCTGITTIVMSFSMRLPMIAAWSIPGSVLLMTGLTQFEIGDVVGVYVVVGIVSAILSFTGVFDTIVRLVPSGITNGILAGILLPICFRAVQASQNIPLMAVVMLLAFLIARRYVPLFAIPAAMAAGIVALFLTGSMEAPAALIGEAALAQPVWITPSFNFTAILSLGIPLFLVTMAGQNLPGIDMMRSLGYRFNAKAALTACNIGGVIFAPFGLHSANLATVTGLVCASQDAHPVRRKRYVSGLAAGIFYILAGTFAPVVVMLMTIVSAPALALLSGLVLLPALSTALSTLMSQRSFHTTTQGTAGREAGIVALVVTASELTVLGMTSPSWGLAAGVVVFAILGARKRQRPTATAEPTHASPAAHPNSSKVPVKPTQAASPAVTLGRKSS